MNKLWSSKVKEEIYIEKLENGLTVFIIPKKNTSKKYVILGTEFGSIDNHFILDGNEIIVPDGIAHYLEHKLFEQKNGKNSLDVLSSLGVEANAYTTNNHTAFLFETTENFYSALDEFMDYIQNPYFTDENVEKERGIIGQEIKMYDDYPDWRVYFNAIQAMYKDNPIKIDVVGTVNTIEKIDKNMLYTIYKAFYMPNNMALVLSGDFIVEDIIKEVKKRIKPKEENHITKRIYPVEQDEILKNCIEEYKDISKPIFIIGYKDKVNEENKVKKDISIEIIANIIAGKSSSLYQRLYEQGLISSEFSFNYEYAKTYSHILFQNTSNDPKKVLEEFENEVNFYFEQGFNNDDFERIKNKIYGEYVRRYNNVSDIADDVLINHFKGINSFDFLDECAKLDKQYVEMIFKQVFKKDRIVLSIVYPKNKD